jgi:hypothetical protein
MVFLYYTDADLVALSTRHKHGGVDDEKREAGFCHQTEMFTFALIGILNRISCGCSLLLTNVA